MAVVIVRHGERSDYADNTWVDAQRKNDGRHWDPPLTSVGKLQAKACGERLVNFPSDHGVPGNLVAQDRRHVSARNCALLGTLQNGGFYPHAALGT